MCVVSTDHVFGETVPAVPLLFGAHAFMTTRPARDFLSLLLLRRHRRRLSVEPASPDRARRRRPKTIADLPTELIHLIRSELLVSAAEASRAEWESTFLKAHDACRHADFPLDPRLSERNSRAASPAPGKEDEETEENGWWNGCFWCDKVRSDALWELPEGDSSDLFKTTREFLARHSLGLASNRPLDYLTAPASLHDSVFVICRTSDRSPSPPVLGCKPCPFSEDASPASSGQGLFTRERILAADLESCSVDEDEGAVGYVEDVRDPSKLDLGPAKVSEVRRRLDRVWKECRLDGADPNPRWLRVVDVDCQCT